MNLTENAAKSIICEVDKIYLKILLSSHFCQPQFLDKVNQMAQPKLTLHSKASALMLEIAKLKEEDMPMV